MDVTIIGTGNMGRSVGTRFVKGGRQLILISGNLESTAALANHLREVAAPNASVKLGSYQEGIKDDVVILAV